MDIREFVDNYPLGRLSHINRDTAEKDGFASHADGTKNHGLLCYKYEIRHGVYLRWAECDTCRACRWQYIIAYLEEDGYSIAYKRDIIDKGKRAEQFIHLGLPPRSQPNYLLTN